MDVRISLAVVATLAALLAGCGDSDDGGPTTTAAGNSPRPCDTSPDSDDVYAGFPVDEVPLLEGEVKNTWNGRDNGEYGCSLSVQRSETAGPAVQAAVGLLLEAGFTITDEDLDDESNPSARLIAENYRIGVSGYDRYESSGSSVDYDLRGPYLEEVYDDAEADKGDADLPEGFPVDELPLVEGRISEAVASVDYQDWPGYDVRVVVSMSATTAGEAAVAALVGAGLAEVEPMVVEVGSGTARLQDDLYVVRLLVSEDKEEEQVRVEYDIVNIPQTSLSLPASWPDAVPVIDGQVILVDEGPDYTQITVLADPPLDDLVDDVRQLLDAEPRLRFDEQHGVYETSTSRQFQYNADGFELRLSVGNESTTRRAVVSYTVVPTS